MASTTRPHTTSIAVWEVPSPVVTGRSFRVKVGVKCSEQCRLAGERIEVCDEGGRQIGEGRLGEVPWPRTSGLYVADVALDAPVREGILAWSARFMGVAAGSPHEEASAVFSLRTARPPEHRLSVRVTDKATDAPLEAVEVRLGVYRASTDAQGLACLEVPGGIYNLDAWKAGYEALSRTVQANKDLTIRIEAWPSPEKDPDDEQVWM
ncbi:MAG TPA: carboxypeptidase-like regulatory domain-containing protein [Vicinamibacterales bacterium]|jgi:hypothetical protein